MNLTPANIDFNAQGTPVASDFDDVYFSNANGLEETRYVFLMQNQLPNRWQQWQNSHFHIAETGFGTGLNFLATWQAFSRFRADYPDSPLRQLYFSSTEKYPLSASDLTAALTVWQELADEADALISQYPLLVNGCHRLIFENGAVVLDLWLDDIVDSLPQWSDKPGRLVDAWFLDGFAPSKNPQMWSDTLFRNMARLSHQHSTFATFTAAGVVRRGLKAAGFKVEKRNGFGHKRDMLAGEFAQQDTAETDIPMYYRGSAKLYDSAPRIAIVGAGLAGASTAYHLARKGFKIQLYCRDSEIAQGASGNAQGGFYPQLHAQASVNALIHASAFIYARQAYIELLKRGFSYDHQWCGVLQLAFNDKVAQRQQQLIDNGVWPADLIHAVDPKRATELAGLELPYAGLWLPHGGWINPPSLVNAWLQAANTLVSSEVLTSKSLMSAQRTANHWQLHWHDGEVTEADIVIFACGAQSPGIEQLSGVPLRLVRGQVEQVPTNESLQQLSTVLCHKGYLTPQFNGCHALGSTYVKQDTSTDFRQSEQQDNLQMHQAMLEKCHWRAALDTNEEGRASIRCSTPDHLPVVGAVADLEHQKQQYQHLYKALPAEQYPQAADQPNLFVLSGLGSRGLNTAPLMAEILASQITGAPLPLSQRLLSALNPNRFLIRELIRQQA